MNFSVPVKEEIKRIGKNGEETLKAMSYKIKIY